jgi:hypothetical protein
MNLLVSPYFPRSGGTVIDWAPPDWTEGGNCLQIQRLNPEKKAIEGTFMLTGQLGPEV